MKKRNVKKFVNNLDKVKIKHTLYFIIGVSVLLLIQGIAGGFEMEACNVAGMCSY